MDNIKNIHYVSLSDMMEMIRRNIWKVPHDIDFVVAVPRSGMIPGAVIAEFINVPLIDVDSFIHGCQPVGGNRLNFIHWRAKPHPKVLVIDDTYYSGTAMIRTRAKLEKLSNEFQFIYCVAYREGVGNPFLDFYLDDVSKYSANNIQVVYEWNSFHHYPHIMDACMYDVDGLLCIDPPDDRNTEAYESYIKNATPLFCPTTTIGKICTYRIIKYKDITENWLRNHNIKYKELIMFDAQSREERNSSGIGPAEFKAQKYSNDPTARLFVESDDWQSRRIYELTHKQVLCTSSNKLYGEILI